MYKSEFCKWSPQPQPQEIDTRAWPAYQRSFRIRLFYTDASFYYGLIYVLALCAHRSCPAAHMCNALVAAAEQRHYRGSRPDLPASQHWIRFSS